MRALYLSTREDQASWFPPRHSLTRRVSSQALPPCFSAVIFTGLIGWHSPARSSNKAALHSRGRRVPVQQDGNCRPCSWLRQGYPDSPETAAADSPPESPAHHHRATSVR